VMETREGFDRTLWKQMASELGLQGLALPETLGGQGFGFLELGLVFEEMGRALLPSPLFSTIALAAGAIRHAGEDSQRRALLPPIASGECVATLALLEPGGGWDACEVSLEAQPDGEGFRLTGTKVLVGDGHVADLLVVAARLAGTDGEDGITLLTTRADAPGLRAAEMESLDPTRRLTRLDFDGARAAALGEPGGAASALARTLQEAAVLLAADCAGGAARCLEMAVAHAKTRVQFARPIGSFQAIKHKCAEVLLEVESAKAAAAWAAWIAEQSPAELPQAASLAKALCCDAYLRAAAENIQIHGGIGFTWEADPQLYYRRARSNQTLLGDSTHHRARLVDALGA
jgi:alkylation response protein AidB-like acyl-CoA dehydrogenase